VTEPTPAPVVPARTCVVAADQSELADLVRAAALSVAGVARMHAGQFGEVATYLVGRRVVGVRLRADHVEVHVVLTSGTPLLSIATSIRARVAPLVGRPVNVTVEDLLDPRPNTPTPIQELS